MLILNGIQEYIGLNKSVDIVVTEQFYLIKIYIYINISGSVSLKMSYLEKELPLYQIYYEINKENIWTLNLFVPSKRATTEEQIE